MEKDMNILVVEDEVRLCEAVIKILKKDKHLADGVHNGEDGLDYGLTGLYDVILLDIMLPGLDGLSVLRRLREAKVATPVILLTARDMTGDKVRGLDTGADDYLTKPFEAEELLARIRAVSRRKGELAPDDPSFGDLVLKAASSELSCCGRSIALSLKEYQMMEILLRNGERIVTKELLIEKIWGYDSDAVHNNVEVYISFLRKKLKFLGSAVEIQTARGLGYRMKP